MSGTKTTDPGKTLAVTLPVSGEQILVEVRRKKMKLCRLKVYPDRRVTLSLPYRVSFSWAEAFLEEKRGWIEEKLAAFPGPELQQPGQEWKDGSTVQLLGTDRILTVRKASRPAVSEGEGGGQIMIDTPSPEDPEAVKRLYETWLRREALRIFEERTAYWQQILAPYGVPLPQIRVRKMKTLWGSCSVGRRTVTFNLYLIKAPMDCVDYVVLHELVHFLHPDHSKAFYGCLSRFMPDHRERKARLDRENRLPR